MNKTTIKRLVSLLPKGIPRWIRCYDNGGSSADRYTVCFTSKAGNADGEYSYRAMSEFPFHPQGVGLWCSNKNHHCDVNKSGFAPAMGCKNHLGKRIPFSELSPDCKQLVMQDYREIWNLPKPIDCLAVKLHPARFSAMSPKMESIVGYIIGQDWVTPQINGLSFTSDGFVLASVKGDCGANYFVGTKEDLRVNWGNMLNAVDDLATDELQLAARLFAEKVK
jgi:hypothetical protein